VYPWRSTSYRLIQAQQWPIEFRSLVNELQRLAQILIPSHGWSSAFLLWAGAFFNRNPMRLYQYWTSPDGSVSDAAKVSS
jgi:hypothetical protein